MVSRMFPFDPSKMDPKTLMELSQLVQQLPPEKLNEMQRLMHNMMAGFDVKKDIAAFEASLPPEFRTKLLKLMATSMPIESTGQQSTEAPQPIRQSPELDLREARLTVLRAVQEGNLSPEEAEKILFKES